MAKKRIKDFFMKKPVERHTTAPLFNSKNTQPESNVIEPGEWDVIHAKEYVDENQK
ncbi:MAG TPA: DUF3787 domain-containing protein [Clostridiales bacterium]|nr:DUF3787 domain-containing protein [Clostridiales bacterium]